MPLTADGPSTNLLLSHHDAVVMQEVNGTPFSAPSTEATANTHPRTLAFEGVYE